MVYQYHLQNVIGCYQIKLNNKIKSHLCATILNRDVAYIKGQTDRVPNLDLVHQIKKLINLREML